MLDVGSSLPPSAIDPTAAGRRNRAGERASERAILNLVSHYMATGLALLNVTDPFTVLGLVEPPRCPVVARAVVALGSE